MYNVHLGASTAVMLDDLQTTVCATVRKNKKKFQFRNPPPNYTHVATWRNICNGAAYVEQEQFFQLQSD